MLFLSEIIMKMQRVKFILTLFLLTSLHLTSCSKNNSVLFENNTLNQFDPNPILENTDSIQCKFTYLFMAGQKLGLYRMTLLDNFKIWLNKMLSNDLGVQRKFIDSIFNRRFTEASFSICPSADSGCQISFVNLRSKNPILVGNLGRAEFLVMNRDVDEISLINTDIINGSPIISYNISLQDGSIIGTKLVSSANIIRYTTTMLGNCQ
jgi:hypothetical protein